MKDSYEDIIHLERPVSTRHTPMPLRNRAAQFAPFAALNGHEEAIQEAGRFTEEAMELTESEVGLLDRTLQEVLSRPEQPVSITYFVPDATKQGGSYATVTECIKEWNEWERVLILRNGLHIPLDTVLRLDEM
jgi:hypothetical protein